MSPFILSDDSYPAYIGALINNTAALYLCVNLSNFSYMTSLNDAAPHSLN